MQTGEPGESPGAKVGRGQGPFTHLAREGRMTVTIGRRELLAGLGGVAAALPLATRAQQPERSAASLYYRSGRREPRRSVSGKGQDRLKRSLMNSGSHPEAVL